LEQGGLLIHRRAKFRPHTHIHTQTHTHTRRMPSNEGRDQGYVSQTKECHRLPANHQKIERGTREILKTSR
jgi:hypothetical protein